MAQTHTDLNDDHPVWGSFTSDERERMLKDDHDAWHNVCFVLIAIVSVGLMIAVTAVTITSITSF